MLVRKTQAEKQNDREEALSLNLTGSLWKLYPEETRVEKKTTNVRLWNATQKVVYSGFYIYNQHLKDAEQCLKETEKKCCEIKNDVRKSVKKDTD